MIQFKYDSEAKIFSIRLLDKKSVDSDIQGNLVLDYDEKGHLVNIDIMDFNLEDLARLPKSHRALVK